MLCGGQSKRMGAPKAWLPFGGERLLQRVVHRLATIACPVVVVRAPGQTLPELPASTLIAEDAIASRGPLQGIASGLAALDGVVEAAFVSSTDAPFVDPVVVKYLHEVRSPNDDLVVPLAGGRRHPLAAIYAVHVRPMIEQMLAEDHLRLMDLLDRVHTRIVGEDELVTFDPHVRFLTNLNTPEEYRAACEDDSNA